MDNISIIIATYNRNVKQLNRAMNSVLEQTNSNWSLIVVGDGVAPSINYEPFKDRNLLVAQAPHTASAGETRNFGGFLVPDSWMGFLDDDDILEPEYVAKWTEEHADADIWICKMDDYGNILPRKNVIEYANVGINFAIKTNKFLELDGFWNERIYGNEDFEFLERAEKHNSSIKYSNYIGYTVRPGNKGRGIPYHND